MHFLHYFLSIFFGTHSFFQSPVPSQLASFVSDLLLLAIVHDRMKFLAIGTKTGVEVYAWAQRPYSKFMAFKSFTDLVNKPLLVDMVSDSHGKSKVIFASTSGFHSIDVESAVVQNIYIPASAVS